MSDIPYIIAIGASSGSLEEINSFFDYTIALDVSYVIIHDFSVVNFTSLTELLSRHSKLSVQQVTHKTKLEINTVYLLPVGQAITIENYSFYFQPIKNTEQADLMVDIFFKSLALCCGNKAIGIILSGNGINGTASLKEIKSAGGTVIVRNPKTTVFSELPASAIASGMVDYVVEPESMPALLAAIISGEPRDQIMAELFKN